MSITGTGTILDPFMAHTALELRTALTLLDGAYVKMANHIDCNDDCRRWNTLNVKASYLLMDNKDLLNIYATDGAIVFNKTNGLFKIQNGRILNLTLINSVFNVSNYSTTGTDTDKYNNVLYDLAISARITGCGAQGYIYNRGTYFDYCNINIKSTIPNSSQSLFLANTIVNQGVLFNDSKLVANTNDQNAKLQSNPFSINANYRNSRVEAHTNVQNESGNYAIGTSSSSAAVSIFKLTGNASRTFSYLSLSSQGINPFYSDAAVNTNRSTEKSCTLAQICNSAYLNGIGFANVEVTN